jgi:dolichyl-phosphate-mannose-protein mannosyltransferase
MKPSAAGWFFAALAVLTAAAIYREATRPGSVFLHPAPRGEWIRSGDPLYLKASGDAVSGTYRARFAVSEPPHSAPLVVRATGPANVRLDGRRVSELPDPSDWNEPRTVELASALAPGEHELEIEITHAGANALTASVEPLAVATGTHWLARGRDGVWRNAALAARPTPSRVAEQMAVFARPALGWLAGAALFALGFGALLRKRHRILKCSTAQLRWFLLGIWSLVAVNDFAKLPVTMGMDFSGHIDYVKFIVDRGALPLATDGWEMFQAPLYYLLCAGIASLYGEWNGLVIRLFWLISIASALAQIEIAYRLSRRVFPDREDLQKVAIAVSGLLPMGFCVSQGVGNEPLHGALAALTLLFAVRLVQHEGPVPSRDAIALGALWGLALLAKVTAALLVAPLLYALWCRLRGRSDRKSEWISASLAGVSAATVAGWYYVRNWIAFGSPFALGTSVAGGALPPDGFWWQEPGYRLVAQLFRFGSGLTRPFDAASHGFWDNYYSTLWADGAMGSKIEFDLIPPWNYGPMLASVWLAIVPSALIAIGFARAMVARRDHREELIQIGALALATLVAAALLLYVRLPVYSQGKATYLLGLTPIFGLLAASGCGEIRNDRARIAAMAGLAGWAVLVLGSYSVI